MLARTLPRSPECRASSRYASRRFEPKTWQGRFSFMKVWFSFAKRGLDFGVGGRVRGRRATRTWFHTRDYQFSQWDEVGC